MDFKLSCENPGTHCTLRADEKNGVTLVTVHASFDEKTIPEKFSLLWKFPDTDCYSVWSPSILYDRRPRPNWNRNTTLAKLASSMPLHQINSADGENRICVALSDCDIPTRIYSGVCEEDACYDFGVEFFVFPTSPIDEYTAQVRIDTRKMPYGEALADAVRWWESDCGYKSAFVPDAAREPVDSLWYSFHQDLHADEIVEECRLSAAMGMKTVIIDDGWQTDDMNRGYSYCGDWKAAPGKIGDMRALTERLHELGMKVVLWFSVPFLGIHAEKFDEFSDMLLDGDDENKTFFCLDPRYKKVRDYLTEIYINAVTEWKLDGLKLDFLDSFWLTGASAEPDSRRDYSSLEDGITALMSGVHKKLTAIKPDIMIEFRQSYVGPSIRTYGNMLRVSDCPNDALSNRQDVINLRFTSGKTAVHSDMVMWNKTDSIESAALQMASIIFAVPQVSVKIAELPEGQRKMLKFYLDFWHSHKKVLLDGAFSANNPESSYSSAKAALDGEAVVALYTESVLTVTENKTAAVNAGAAKQVIVKGAEGKSWQVVNCLGERLSSGTLNSPLEEIPVPPAGILFIET